MKVLREGERIHSQSQLLFLRKGMRAWLQSMGELQSLGVETRGAPRQPALAESVEATVVALLTDMALHTWKEAS